jgi:TPR repeat protein
MDPRLLAASALLLAAFVPAIPAGAQDAPPAPKLSKPGSPPQTPSLPSPLDMPVDAPLAAGAPAMDRFGDRPADPAYAAFQRGLYITALNLALPKAEEGDRASQMLAAEIYARGLGVERNNAEATRWYMLAAEQGDAEAQLQAAMILLGDKPLDRANPNRAEALEMLRASADAGNAYAAFNLAQVVMAEKPGDEGARQARALFETAAAKQVPGALYALARFHLTGIGGAAIDGAKARDLMSRAARAGLDTAQLDLATSLADGLFGARDYPEAFIWMRRAALGGNVLAANRLAKLYMYGLGNEGDAIAAAAWYIRAKRAGITDPEMEDYLEGLTDEERAEALTMANAPL